MKIYGLILLVLVLAGSALYHLGSSGALVKANYSTAISTIKTLRDKGEINVQVSHSVADALCRDYGLPDSEIPECMRGVREASAKP